MASETIAMNGDVDKADAEEAPSPARSKKMARPLNMNTYANKKSAVESMLDVALLMANASQLKAVLEQGPSLSFYTGLIALISISLILQVVVGILLIFLELQSHQVLKLSPTNPLNLQHEQQAVNACSGGDRVLPNNWFKFLTFDMASLW
uniref:Ninjurin 1 n=1 Tax=Pygocentrus nattereri TaxID=42514 RepID=A0AAR2JDS8_PYGNA